jgi:hypothetical protein
MSKEKEPDTVNQETSEEAEIYDSIPYNIGQPSCDFGDDFSFSQNCSQLIISWIHAKMKMGNVIEYDSRNPHYKNRFASLEATLQKINPVFSEFGLALTQWPSKGVLINRLDHISGQWMMSKYELAPVKRDPQALGSSITYARRYCAQAIAGICGGEDDDAEITMAPDSGGSPSAKADGPIQSVEDIASEFSQSVTEENYEQELNSQWDTLMRKCNKMNDRKKLAKLLRKKQGIEVDEL